MSHNEEKRNRHYNNDDSFTTVTETANTNTNTNIMSEEIDIDEWIAQRHQGKDVDADLEVDVDDDIEAFSDSPPTPASYSTTKKVESSAYAAPKYDDMPMTAGHHTADPFAPREGKTLVWRDVNMTLVRTILFTSRIFR